MNSGKNPKPLAGSLGEPGTLASETLAHEAPGTQAPGTQASEARVLERKIRFSKLALLFERAWPRLWLLLGVAGLFIIISMAGLWPLMGTPVHEIALVVFAVALLASLMALARISWPDRDQAIRRIERVSGVAHRPASSFEDTASSAQGDPAASALWQAHRGRLAKLIGKLRVGSPAPRTDRRDPFALRALLMLGVFIATIIAGDSAADRLRSAFRFSSEAAGISARLDAWVTPPAYTARPPVMLADGSRALETGKKGEARQFEVPENSVLIVRMSGIDPADLALEVTKDGEKAAQRIKAAAPAKTPHAGPPGDIGEIRYTLKEGAKVRVVNGRTKIARWTFNVIPDQPPTIALLKTPGRSRRGRLKLAYKIEDDYGAVKTEARFKRLPEPPRDKTKDWARKPALTGPRHPLPAPPVLKLTLPRVTAKGGKAKSSHDFAEHAWAGVKARMDLTVTDHAGQTGKAERVDLMLPARRFRNPLARAIIEQRRHLMWDSRMRHDVLFALKALSRDPEANFKNKPAYLGLRSAYHRLRRNGTRKGIKSVVDQLWSVALRIADGNLSDAERRLRDIQDKLAKALEQGASSEEIAKLMQELRQALADYMRQLAEQSKDMKPQMSGRGRDQFITSQDFERMLRQLENMARSGNRDAAQQMLSEMRDLLDRLRSGRMASNGQSRQMMEMMDKFGDLIGKQQKLLDDTFRQQQRQQGEGKRGQRGQRQGQGPQGGGPPGRGPPGQGGQGPKGQQGKGGKGRGNQPGAGELARRQGQLREMLNELSQGMRQFGLKPPGQFGDAGKSMGKSKRALKRGDLGEGTRQERQALDQLRQGARSMAEQMLSRMARRYGQGRNRGPLDPLGRPRADNGSEGTEFNNRVGIPDTYGAQRSREILEELRRRLGESMRPPVELDYIERLLKRF